MGAIKREVFMAADQRKNPRHDLRCKVVCSFPENPTKKFNVTSVNISLGGLGLKLNNFIRESKYLKIAIFDPNKKRPVKAKGRIVWQKHFRDFTERRAGIQFTDIPWTKIKSLVESTV